MSDIGAWLATLGLAQFTELFQENLIDREVLPELTEADLEKLGLPLGARKKLLKAIAALGNHSARAEPAKATPTRPAEAERRQLTVLFCDLVGSTELAARLDPEDMSTLIRGYQNAVAGEISRFEGHVAKYMGDGVLAYFGWPRAHEDEAERAVRCGRAIIEAVGELATPTGAPLAARVGIATGLVMVGESIGAGAAREEAVIGETPNLAARLQALAAPGSVVISQATRRLVGGLFELDDLGPQRLKGFAEPLTAFRVVGEGGAEGRFEALHGARLTPLVGRAHELGILLERWAWAKDGDGQVVLLAGEPGIGKSRLVRALRERLIDEPYTPLSHFCSPYHTNSALYPVIGLLERAARLNRDAPPEAQLASLEAVLGGASDRLDEAVPLLAALLGIPSGARYPALNLTPEAQKRRTFEALVEQLAGLAARQPVLALYEDVHWVDPTTIELLGLVVERIRQLPVLVLITFRPEFQPPWTGHAHVTTLTMGRLGRRQGADLVARVTGAKPLPAEIVEQIVVKTDGVPLFVEELTKTVLESGLLVDSGDRYELAGPLPPLAIPTTLHDSLMARLDRLAPVKEVAQIGAVIGREFSHELLAAVADRPEDQLQSALDQLFAAELIFRRGAPPEATYSFKHALVQDAAYQSLLKSRRQQLHAHIAEVLETGSAEAAEEQAEVLAHHLTEAGLVERASEAWAKAGISALSRSAMREAEHSLSRGLALLRQMPRSGDRRRRELDLLVGLGVALTNTHGAASPEAQAVHERASQLANDLGDREGQFRARWNLWRIHNVRGEFDDAIAIGDALLREAESTCDLDHEIQARHTLWSSHFFRGDLETTCSHVDRALAVYDVTRHGRQALVFGGHDVRECGLALSSAALFLRGYPECARARNAEGMVHAMAIGQPQVVAHAHNWGSIYLQLAGQFEELHRRMSTLAHLADEHGLAMYYPEARFFAAWLAAHQERDRRAIREMRNFLDRRAAMGTLLFQTYFLMLLAEARLHLGEPDEALADLDEAVSRATAIGERLCTAELHRLRARACLAQNAAARDAAEASLQAALAEARRRSSRVFELRAARDLARLWAEQGDRHKARDLLAPVYGWFTEGFDTADLKDAKALLDALA